MDSTSSSSWRCIQNPLSPVFPKGISEVLKCNSPRKWEVIVEKLQKKHLRAYLAWSKANQTFIKTHQENLTLQNLENIANVLNSDKESLSLLSGFGRGANAAVGLPTPLEASIQQVMNRTLNRTPKTDIIHTLVQLDMVALGVVSPQEFLNDSIVIWVLQILFEDLSKEMSSVQIKTLLCMNMFSLNGGDPYSTLSPFLGVLSRAKLALPLLKKLNCWDLKEVLSIKTLLQSMPLHNNEIFRIFLPVLEKAMDEKDGPKIVKELLLVPDKNGVCPLGYEGMMPPPLYGHLLAHKLNFTAREIKNLLVQGESDRISAQLYIPLLSRFTSKELVNILLSKDKLNRILIHRLLFDFRYPSISSTWKALWRPFLKLFQPEDLKELLVVRNPIGLNAIKIFLCLEIVDKEILENIFKIDLDPEKSIRSCLYLTFDNAFDDHLKLDLESWIDSINLNSINSLGFKNILFFLQALKPFKDCEDELFIKMLNKACSLSDSDRKAIFLKFEVEDIERFFLCEEIRCRVLIHNPLVLAAAIPLLEVVCDKDKGIEVVKRVFMLQGGLDGNTPLHSLSDKELSIDCSPLFEKLDNRSLFEIFSVENKFSKNGPIEDFRIVMSIGPALKRLEFSQVKELFSIKNESGETPLYQCVDSINAITNFFDGDQLISLLLIPNSDGTNSLGKAMCIPDSKEKRMILDALKTDFTPPSNPDNIMLTQKQLLSSIWNWIDTKWPDMEQVVKALDLCLLLGLPEEAFEFINRCEVSGKIESPDFYCHLNAGQIIAMLSAIDKNGNPIVHKLKGNIHSVIYMMISLSGTENGSENVLKLFLLKNKAGASIIDSGYLNASILNSLDPAHARQYLLKIVSSNYLLTNVFFSKVNNVYLNIECLINKSLINNVFGVDFDPQKIHADYLKDVPPDETDLLVKYSGMMKRWIALSIGDGSDPEKLVKVFQFAVFAGGVNCAIDYIKSCLDSERKEVLRGLNTELLLKLLYSEDQNGTILAHYRFLKPLIDVLYERENGYKEVINLFKKQDLLGCTPIHSAPDAYMPYLERLIKEENGLAEVVRILSIQNNIGKTPLHLVFLSNNSIALPAFDQFSPEDIINLLSIRDINGKTSLSNQKFIQAAEPWLRKLSFDQIKKLFSIPYYEGTYPVLSNHSILLASLSFISNLDKEQPGQGILKKFLELKDPMGESVLRIGLRDGGITKSDLLAVYGIEGLNPEEIVGLTIEDREDSLMVTLANWYRSRPLPLLDQAKEFFITLGYPNTLSQLFCFNFLSLKEEERIEALIHEGIPRITEMLSEMDVFLKLPDVEINSTLFDVFFNKLVVPILMVLCKIPNGSKAVLKLLGSKSDNENIAFRSCHNTDATALLNAMHPEDARELLSYETVDRETLLMYAIKNALINKELILKLYNINFDPKIDDLRHYGAKWSENVTKNMSLKALIPIALKNWIAATIQESDDDEKQTNGIKAIEFAHLVGCVDVAIAGLDLLPERDGDILFKQVPKSLQSLVLLKEYDLDPMHMQAGASLETAVPDAIPMTSSLFLGAKEKPYPEFFSFIPDLIVGGDIEADLAGMPLNFQTKTGLLAWERKIRENEHIYGLDQNNSEKRKEQYRKYCCYLTHVVNAYKIGYISDQNTDINDKRAKFSILNMLAEVQEVCFPRWKKEIQIAHIFRPRDPSEIDEDPATMLPTFKDRLLARFRAFRIDILSRQMLIEGENLHEPNYLLDLFREELGTKLEATGDLSFDTYNKYYSRSPQMIRKIFYQIYNKYQLLDGLTDHLRAQQKDATKDTLSLPLDEVTNWLQMQCATSWKQDEYDDIERLAYKCNSESEVESLFNRYAIEWPKEESVKEAKARLDDSITRLTNYITSIKNLLSGQRKEFEVKLKDLLAIKCNDVLFEEKWRKRRPSLQELFKTSAIKEGQVLRFFREEVFEGYDSSDETEIVYSKKAAFHLLNSTGILEQLYL